MSRRLCVMQAWAPACAASLRSQRPAAAPRLCCCPPLPALERLLARRVPLGRAPWAQLRWSSFSGTSHWGQRPGWCCECFGLLALMSDVRLARRRKYEADKGARREGGLGLNTKPVPGSCPIAALARFCSYMLRCHPASLPRNSVGHTLWGLPAPTAAPTPAPVAKPHLTPAFRSPS